MKVPDVVKTARSTSALIATLGPASHSHHEIDRNRWSVRAAGPWSMPRAPRTTCSTPRGSANQFGPLTPSQPSALFTAPLPANRKVNTSTIATELVTEGK